jgi:hypothetical protein
MAIQRRHGSGMGGGFRVAPEQLEGLIEQLKMLAPMHHHGAERGMDLPAIPNINRVQGSERTERFTWPERQAGTAQ